MKLTKQTVAGREVSIYRVRTLVIGSGCAGYNAADWLAALGESDAALMTEGVQKGTSRNTGSDKQTYYKLSLASDEADSVRALAETLWAEGVHGDTALVEAACSAQSFFKLVQLGVPFPKNEYGEYVGYKTDHDPRRRATSAGPLTSKLMTERLEAQVAARGIPVLDRMMAFALLVREGRVAGVLAYDLDARALTVVLCAHVVLCTGGPAALYDASVYPGSQTGMSGMALAAGAKAANLHHWQYGLASTKFRWNVSGSYQQVLPRYISVDADGVEREFLAEAFDSPLEAVRRCFLKGYQWPFDVRKTDGSSAIDLLVHHECCVLGRRVYMDFRRNPSCLEGGWDGLDDEVTHYLRSSGATQATPIERLAAMNGPAIALYADHGIDLWTEPLEVAVCAQHHNGGIAVDTNWQSSVPGLYVAGEAAGTFGAYRPGGSALNATQVGAMRAAEHIAYDSKAQAMDAEEAMAWLADALEAPLAFLTLEEDPLAIAGHNRKEMSRVAAHLRMPGEMRTLLAETEAAGCRWRAPLPKALPEDMSRRLKLRDQLITQQAVLEAMLRAAELYGSTGAGLVDDPAGAQVVDGLSVRAMAPVERAENTVLQTALAGDVFRSALIPARPMPEGEQWFEKAWGAFRKRTERE